MEMANKLRCGLNPWIPRQGSRIPITPHHQNLLTRVQELIDPITGDWDELLVRNTFWDVDASKILKIPIRDDFDDYPAWHFDEKGLFSVKSAYHLGRVLMKR
jgi:hypothetical protein